jgi:hypothetical protein
VPAAPPFEPRPGFWRWGPVYVNRIANLGERGGLALSSINCIQNRFLSIIRVSAFILTHLSSNLGIGFPFSLILASLAAVPLGLLIGLPALRLRGSISRW